MNPTAIALSPPAWIARRGQAGTAIAPGVARAFAQLRSSRALHLLALVGLMTLCFDHMAFAQTVTGGGTGSLTTFLTNVVNLLTGTLGQSIAVIAVAGVGIAWALGQASPRFALGTVVGVAILFSSAWIVGQISGNGGG
jgi:type IV secretory pathway VirB2 component (pilin)